MNLFVYGCLKRGGSLSTYLNNFDFVKVCETSPNFKLFDLGGYPGMILDEEGGNSIKGELWDVSDFEELDIVECVDEGLFQRKIILLSDNTEAYAYLYNQDVSRATQLTNEWTLH